MANMNRAYHGIILHPDGKMKIPLICCNYFSLKAQIVDLLEKRKCSEKAQRSVRQRER